MTADKIAEARALIEPLTGHTEGPWFAHGRYIGTKNHKSSIGECRDENGNWSDTARSSVNAALIAAAPALRDTVAALADLADAQAQEIAKQAGRIEALEAALKRCLNYLENTEGEFRITLDSADAARAALGETP